MQAVTSSSDLQAELNRPASTEKASTHRDVVLRRLLGTADMVVVVVAVAVTILLPGSQLSFSHDFVWALAAIPTFVVVFKLYGLYDRDVKRISHSTVDDIPWLAHALLVGTLLFWAYAKLTPMHRLALVPAVSFALLTLVLDCAARSFVRHASSRVLPPEATLLVGGGAMAGVLVKKLRAHPEYRLSVVGRLHRRSPDNRPFSSGDSVPTSVERLGGIDDLEAVVGRHRIGRIVVSPSEVDGYDLSEVLRRCRKLQVKVTILPALSDTLGTVEIDDVEGVTVLGVNPPWLPRSSRALKRLMDLALAGPIMLIGFPLMLALALAVKLDSRGPVFFTQVRVGKGGRRFRVFKFRTMVVDAEVRRAELLARSSDPNWLKLERDPRITRVGRRLRRLSLDELPQLWNVLRGEMSLVGPRPLIPLEDERITGWQRGRLDLTPGITGYWQVLGRTRIPFEEMTKLDYLYVMNWSLWEDIRLILRTLPAVLAGRGAN